MYVFTFIISCVENTHSQSAWRGHKVSLAKVSMYICTCMYTHIMWTHCFDTCIRIYDYTYTCTRIYIHTYIYMYIHMVYILMSLCFLSLHHVRENVFFCRKNYIYIYTYIHIYMFSVRICACTLRVHVCVLLVVTGESCVAWQLAFMFADFGATVLRMYTGVMLGLVKVL